MEFELVNLPNGAPVQNVYRMTANEHGEIAIICNQGVLILDSGGTKFFDFGARSKFPWLEGERVPDIGWG